MKDVLTLVLAVAVVQILVSAAVLVLATLESILRGQASILTSFLWWVV